MRVFSTGGCLTDLRPLYLPAARPTVGPSVRNYIRHCRSRDILAEWTSPEQVSLAGNRQVSSKAGQGRFSEQKVARKVGESRLVGQTTAIL